MNKTTRKLKKKKERERQNALCRHQESIRRLYPRFDFEDEGNNPRFTELIKKAIYKIDLSDRSIFTDWEIDLYKMGVRYGKKHIVDFMNSEDKLKTTYFICKIGQLVCDMIGQNVLSSYIPFHDFRILPVGRKIIVKFASLKSKSGGPNGIIYYSPFEPKVKIGNTTKIVSFSRHAVEQICNRIVPRWQSYAGCGDAFCFFYSCVYFEPCRLKNGNTLAFTFYDKCSPRFWTYNYVTKLLKNPDPKKQYYYRVGYCPATIEGDFIKAKTLLVPGYRNTPELDLLYETTMPESTRRQFVEKAEKLSTLNLMETGDFSILQWFHNNGIRQVIETNREFYRYV